MSMINGVIWIVSAKFIQLLTAVILVTYAAV